MKVFTSFVLTIVFVVIFSNFSILGNVVHAQAASSIYLSPTTATIGTITPTIFTVRLNIGSKYADVIGARIILDTTKVKVAPSGVTIRNTNLGTNAGKLTIYQSPASADTINTNGYIDFSLLVAPSSPDIRPTGDMILMDIPLLSANNGLTDSSTQVSFHPIITEIYAGNTLSDTPTLIALTKNPATITAKAPTPLGTSTFNPVSNLSGTSARVSWNTVAGADTYWFQVSNTNQKAPPDNTLYFCTLGIVNGATTCTGTEFVVGSPTTNAWTSVTSVDLTNLSCGTTYFAHVKAGLTGTQTPSSWTNDFSFVTSACAIATPTPTKTPTPTSIPTNQPTNTPTRTPTPTALPTNQPTNTPTATPTSTRTPTPTILATSTPLPTSTPTALPTATRTPTSTRTPTPTALPTNIPTATPTATRMPTSTPLSTATPTRTPTSTRTPTPTALPTAINTPTAIATPTAFATATPAPNESDTIFATGHTKDRRNANLQWTTTQTPERGFKIVWSRRTNPTYPNQAEGNVTVSSTQKTVDIRVNASNQTYYFRVCAFDGFRCRNYSNNVMIDMSIRPSPTPTFGLVEITPKTTPIYTTIDPQPTTTETLIAGDANRDGTVNGKDYIVWKIYNGKDVDKFTKGDVDGNGKVDNADRIIIIKELLKKYRSDR